MGITRKSAGLTGAIGAAVVSLIVYAVKSPAVQSAVANWRDRPVSPGPAAPKKVPGNAGSAVPNPNPPATLRIAPAGSLFLTQKLTVITDSVPKTFPVGTIFQVKSRQGPNIIGTINGTPIRVDASAASSVAP